MLTEKTKTSHFRTAETVPGKALSADSCLHLAQAEVGYLPREMQDEVARLFGIEPNEVQCCRHLLRYVF